MIFYCVSTHLGLRESLESELVGPISPLLRCASRDKTQPATESRERAACRWPPSDNPATPARSMTVSVVFFTRELWGLC
jgi:hypothetical protein